MNATNLVLERIINQQFVSIGMRQVSATTPRLREIRAKEIWSGNGLVSFDVFDTLITRPVQRPSDMFLLTGYRLQRQFGPRVAPGEWFSIRQSAETRARKTRVEREVTLNDIYAEIAASTDLPE